MWRYRDYVIRAFNEDKPYDRFIKEQLAGDELWPDDQEALIATGFLRSYPDEINARDLNLKKQEIAVDLTNTTGSVFLAATVGCANCHNHKFDKISQREYFQMQAFFINASARDDVSPLRGKALADYQQAQARYDEATKDIRDRMAAILKPVRRQARAGPPAGIRAPDPRLHREAGRTSAMRTTAGSTTATCGLFPDETATPRTSYARRIRSRTPSIRSCGSS